MKKAIIALVFFAAACGFLPTGDNYPYDMYDSDLENFMEVLELGKDSGVPVSIIGEDDGKALVESDLWGKITDYKVVRRQYVRMIGHYWVEVTLAYDMKKCIRVSYHPNLGRVEIVVRDSDMCSSEK